MKFKDYKYERPDFDVLKHDTLKFINQIKNATEENQFFEAFEKINDIRRHFYTQETLASIRYTLDTSSTFLESEKMAMDDMSPDFESLVNAFYKSVLASPYKETLIKKYGTHIIKLIEVKIKAFDDVIIDDLKEENKLMQQYVKLRTSAEIAFKDGIYNLPQMMPFYESTDSDTRKEAHQATSAFFSDNLDAFDNLYDKMVKVRDRMAKKLGFENYVPLGYMRLMRTDYDANDVANYRAQVLEDLVPLTSELREKQRLRLKLDQLNFHDEGIAFLSGNAKPEGTPDEILANGKAMYEALSNDTAEFIHFLYDHELLDVEARTGKSGGGYCEFIYDYKSPFIFSNFNGTSGDVDVLTHEAGHAFQIYQSRDYELPEYVWPTLEACEIHSMSMEFLTWGHMEKFFGPKADKYRYNHLTEALLFIPYGTLVDAFQHEVYEKPDMTPLMRRELWHKLERQYLPHRDYGDDTFLQGGGYWFRQGHIFSNPFYYIDYTLAQVCAFQFHLANQMNHEEAWSRYLSLCKLGGSKAFTELMAASNLENPFEIGTIKKIVKPLFDWLDGQNDEQF